MVMNHISDFGEYPSFFHCHIVLCRLLWNDLVDFDDGSKMPLFLEGFTIDITKSNRVLILKGVPVFFPDMFFNYRVVVHGISDVLAAQDNALCIDVDDEEILFSEPNLSVGVPFVEPFLPVLLDSHTPETSVRNCSRKPFGIAEDPSTQG
ncbi:hypothetical protein JHK86_010091 [Glycine max]|nr:hypothetical protein JHK86_010091 [Glycine max]